MTAGAVVVEHMYRAEVEVENHSRAQLQGATRAGLAQVLVKVSGSRKVLRRESIRAALDENQKYLQRYQYQRQDDGSLALQIHYDSRIVTELLKTSRAPLWTSNRLPLLVWLVVDDGAGRRFPGPDDSPELFQALQSEFTRRGVPVVFPLHDLMDATTIELHDLWQFDRLGIYRASARYSVDNILVGRLTQLSDGRWMGDWLYLREAVDVASSFYGKELPELSNAGSDFVAEQMALRYAVEAGSGVGEAVVVHVENIEDYADYRALVQFLEGIELVDAAYPVYVEGSSVQLMVRAQAEAEQLHRILALDRRLQRLDTAPTLSGGVSAELLYRWQP